MLDDLLKTPTPPPLTPPKRPGGWAYTTEYDPTDPKSQTITATTTERIENDDDIRAFITANGGTIPDGYRAVMVEARHNTSAWHRDGQGLEAETRGAWYYRFRIEPALDRLDLASVLNKLNKRPAKKIEPTTTLPFWFITADQQFAKIDGDGLPGTLERFYDSIDKAITRWKKLGRGPVQIAFLGDCIEGNVSGGGTRMGFRTSLTITEQVLLLTRVMSDTIDAFLKAGATSIDLNVVNGNHDQAQRHPIDTDASDGWATHAAIQLNDAMKKNPDRYNNVHVYIPGKDEDHIVRDIDGTIVVMLHGHQLPKRNGALEWLAKQAVNRTPAGNAQVVLHGHEHSFSIQSIRSAIAICAPTYEDRSVWYQQKHGALSKRGGLVLVTDAGEVSEMSIV